MRTTREEMLVELGELSSAREALEGAALAEGPTHVECVDRREPQTAGAA